MRHDLRSALRALGRDRAYALVALLTLTVGLAANTVMFSLVNGVILRPLPYPAPDQVVRVYASTPEDEDQSASAPLFVDIRERWTAATAVAAWIDTSYALVDARGARAVRGAQVSDAFFDVFGVPAALGRTFSARATETERAPLAVISDRLWRREFGSDPAVIGRAITLNRTAVTVAGVMPADFSAVDQADIWIRATRGVPDPPLSGGDELVESRDMAYLAMVARLAPGRHVDTASAELDAIANTLARTYTEERGRGLRAVSLKDDLVGDVRPALLMLLGAVGLLLLIACANVAGLALARATTRQREVAVRRSLGASRWAIARLLLVENLVIALAGAGLSVAVTAWSLDVLVEMSPVAIPGAGHLAIDWRVVAFVAVAGLASASLVSVAPLATSHAPLEQALREAGRSTTSGARQRLRGFLVAGQIALAATLLVGAGLFIRSFERLQSVPQGLSADDVLSVGVALPPPQYAEPAAMRSFTRRVLDHLRRDGRVTHAAVAFPTPFAPASASVRPDVEGFPEGQEGPPVKLYWIAGDYFATLRIPVLSGRVFSDADGDGAPLVAVVSKGAAERMWPGQDPIGKRLRAGGSEGDGWMTVVGVVGDTGTRDWAAGVQPAVYVSMLQNPFPYPGVVVRGRTGDAVDLTPAVREAVATADRELPLGDPITVEAAAAAAVKAPRFRTWLLAVFSLLASVLASVGLYGVAAYAVVQRRKEFGVRMTLGATRRTIAALVLGDAARLAAFGLATGLVVALLGASAVRQLLFDARHHDPVVFVLVSLGLLAVVLIASAVPAWRATRVDPATVLQAE